MIKVKMKNEILSSDFLEVRQSETISPCCPYTSHVWDTSGDTCIKCGAKRHTISKSDTITE